MKVFSGQESTNLVILCLKKLPRRDIYNSGHLNLPQVELLQPPAQAVGSSLSLVTGIHDLTTFHSLDAAAHPAFQPCLIQKTCTFEHGLLFLSSQMSPLCVEAFSPATVLSYTGLPWMSLRACFLIWASYIYSLQALTTS